MIEVAGSKVPLDQVHYTGIDLFEARRPSDGPVTPLKTVYRSLRGTGARVRLLPGDVLTALSREANNLGGTDLLVISAPQGAELPAQAWFYIPRMLHRQSQLFVETVGPTDRSTIMRRVSNQEIIDRATAVTFRRAA